ncbi:MAG: hypothetical protein AAF512_02040 [Pseudomonadota bacterium]
MLQTGQTFKQQAAAGGGGPNTNGPAGTDATEWEDWLYANDDANITESSGEVSQWDGPNSVISAVASGSARPDVMTDGGSEWNNAQVIDFNGSAEWLDVGSQSIGACDLFAEAGAAETIILAIRNNTASADGTFLSKAGSSSGTRTFQIGSSSNGNFFSIIRGSMTNIVSRDANAHIFVFVIDGATVDAYVDGGSAISCGVGTAAEESRNINIGARTDGSFTQDGETYFIGFRAEIASASLINDVCNDLASDIGTTWTDIS